MSEKLFTVPLSALREDHFRCPGKGGQNVNKRDTGVRFTHEPSGAVGKSCDQRSQVQNRRTALERLAKDPKFVAWARVEAAMLAGAAQIREGDIKVEFGAADCVKNEAYCDVKR